MKLSIPTSHQSLQSAFVNGFRFNRFGDVSTQDKALNTGFRRVVTAENKIKLIPTITLVNVATGKTLVIDIH